jgi:hypothetical protein
MNNIRNFITRSTNNINTVRFRNARPTTTSNTSTTASLNKSNFYVKHFI